MTPFIHDEPFIIEYDSWDPSLRRVEIRLRMAITEPGDSVQAHSSPIEFVLDTGSDYTRVFNQDLAAFGISANRGPLGGWVDIILMDGSKTEGQMRDVTLWLYGNSHEELADPYPIELNRGVLVLTENDYSSNLRPILGMNSLLDAGLCIELDALSRRFSAWIPSR